MYKSEGEPLPKNGEYSVILNENNEAVCVIRTTKVYLTSFSQVGEDHAFKEGEGDRSLEYWRKAHREFFTKELAKIGQEFDEDMELVCEEFELV